MCRTHGGALPQTLDKARDRLRMLVARRAMETGVQRWQRALTDFHADRVMVTAELMGVPVEEVTPVLIGFCHALHGAPALESAAPTAPAIHHMTQRYLDRPH